MTYNIPGTRVLFVFVYVFLLTDDRSDVSAKIFGFLNKILDMTTKNADTEEKNPRATTLSKIEKTANELLSFRAEKFTITIPPSEISIEKRIENETFTERFVYGLKASRLELPCSTGMASQSPFTDFQWSLRNAAINITPTESRLKIGTKKELIFEMLDPMDSGRYTCDGNVNGILHTNIVDLHVYVPADVAMRFPFKFRAEHCNKDEDQNIKSQIEKIFCSTFQPCSFEFTTTCSSAPSIEQSKTDPLQAVLEILVVKYTNPSYQSPTCSVECVMKAKLEDTLSEMISFVTAFKKVGEDVRRVGQCAESSCPSDYVFVPEGTTGGSKLLYVCDAGYMLYRISACVPCWAGHFQPSRGPNEDCRTCPILTYQPNPAAESCIPCETSTMNTSIVGAISSDICFPEEKKVKGIFLILLILILLGIIATVIVILIFRKKSKGEKEPLKAGQQLKNTNQSSRPQSSVTSLRGARRTLSDRSSYSVTQTTIRTESYKKPPASNIKPRVILDKPGHEKTQRVANKPADVKSANIPKRLDGDNFKRSPVASPSGDSGKSPSASALDSTEGDIKTSSAKTSGDTWTNTKPPPTAAITHSTENLKSGIESESLLNKIKSQSGAALNRQMPIAETGTVAAMRTDPPDSADTTHAAASPGTENTVENIDRPKSVDKITNPSPNNNNVNWNAMYSESSWDEEDVELWNNDEVTEMKVLIDGTDDELDSQQDLAFGTKRRGRKLLKR